MISSSLKTESTGILQVSSPCCNGVLGMNTKHHEIIQFNPNGLVFISRIKNLVYLLRINLQVSIIFGSLLDVMMEVKAFPRHCVVLSVVCASKQKGIIVGICSVLLQVYNDWIPNKRVSFLATLHISIIHIEMRTHHFDPSVSPLKVIDCLPHVEGIHLEVAFVEPNLVAQRNDASAVNSKSSNESLYSIHYTIVPSSNVQLAWDNFANNLTIRRNARELSFAERKPAPCTPTH